jgi:glucuronokinase
LGGDVTEGQAFARAGVLGNPSDGFFGKTLSIVVKNYRARATLEASRALRIQANGEGSMTLPSLESLVASIQREGYRGGSPLVQAAIKVFADHCRESGRSLPDRSFTLRWGTSIPRQVGLAGSSAIVTATFRALMAFFEIDIPKPGLANLILAAEQDELGIAAGLQDRVVQVYEGLVYMDFSREIMEERGHGAYEPMDPRLLPRLFVAHRPTAAEGSGRIHGRLRERWERGEANVRDTMTRIAALAEAGRAALLARDQRTFFSFMDENFDLRRSIMPVSDEDLAMVETVRELGAPAKLTGSGGAIVGGLENEAMGSGVRRRLQELGAVVFEPVVE